MANHHVGAKIHETKSNSCKINLSLLDMKEIKKESNCGRDNSEQDRHY